MPEYLFRFRWLFCGLILASWLAGIPFVKKAVKSDNSIAIWFKKDAPVFQQYNEFHRTFGNDRTVMLAIPLGDNGITQNLLLQIDQLTKNLSDIQGIKHIVSLTTVKDFQRIHTEGVTKIEFTRLFSDSSTFDVTPELLTKIESSSLIRDHLISKNGKLTAIIIEFDPIEKMDVMRGDVIHNIRSTVSETLGSHNYHMMGSDVITNDMNELSRRDFGMLTGTGILLMFVIVGILFRRLDYVLLVALVCMGSVWMALTVHGLMGFQINVFSAVSPLVINTLGVITIIHILNEYRQCNAPSKVDRVLISLQRIYKPCLYATVTTIIGFSSLWLTDAVALNQFGFLCSVGLIALFLHSFVFSGIFLLFDKAQYKPHQNRLKGSIIKVVNVVTRHPFRASVLILLLISTFIYGLSKLRIDLYAIGYFSENHRIMIDHTLLEKNWGYYFPVDMVLRVHPPFSLKDRSIIESLQKFNEEVTKNEIIRNNWSFINVMERFTEVAFRQPLANVIANPIRGRTFAEKMLGEINKDSNRLISDDFMSARLTLIGKLVSVRELESNLEWVRLVAFKHFDDRATLEFSGFPNLYIHAMNTIFGSLQKSLGFSLIMIFLMTLLLFRNLRISLIAIIPNVFPILVIFGFMGFADINLDMVTSTVTVVVLGIAIDDTIYFFHWFNNYQKSHSTLDSIREALNHVGNSIFVSSMILIAGFSLMLFAELQTVYYFGLLLVIGVFAALFGDLIILPLMLQFFKRSRKIIPDKTSEN